MNDPIVSICVANSQHMTNSDIMKFCTELWDQDIDIDGEFCLLPTERQPMTINELKSLAYWQQAEVDVYFDKDRSAMNPAFGLP